MKILYGITKSNFGGAQRYVYDLAKVMKAQGHDVAVLCGGNGTLVEKLKEENIRVINLPYLQRDISIVDELRSLHFIFRTLFEEKPDIFHTNSSKMGGLGVVTARLAGVKRIIFTGHGWAFNEPRPWWQRPVIKFFTWLTIIGSHKTICVSEKTKKDVEKWPFIKNKLEVIYNGIELFELVPREDNTFTVGAISELHKIKGLDVLLIAWSKFIKNPARTTVQSGRRQAKLVIMGDGEERENLENMARNLGISDSVDFRGFIENARTHLSSFDIFVMPSRSEAMPCSLLEAGISGRPVIATYVGGIPEVIENGITGALVPPEDPEALLSSLVLFYDNPRMRDRLGDFLKKSVEEKFSKEKMISDTMRSYENKV